jgi:hypothetical protein
MQRLQHRVRAESVDIELGSIPNPHELKALKQHENIA